MVTDVATTHTLRPDTPGRPFPWEKCHRGVAELRVKNSAEAEAEYEYGRRTIGSDEAGEANDVTNSPERPPPGLFSMALW